MFARIQTIAIFSGLLAVACGADAGAKTAGFSAPTAGFGASTAGFGARTAGVGAKAAGIGACRDGTMSVPGGAGDPCAGSTVCGTSPGRVVALCSGGAWGVCSCVSDGMAPGQPAQTGPVCGNNIIEMGEVCEKGMPVGVTCGTLITGSTGTVGCVDCRYDMQLCTMMNSTGGGGTGSGGTGAAPPSSSGDGPCGGTAQPCCPGFKCNAPDGFCHFDVGICFP